LKCKRARREGAGEKEAKREALDESPVVRGKRILKREDELGREGGIGATTEGYGLCLEKASLRKGGGECKETYQDRLCRKFEEKIGVQGVERIELLSPSMG